MKLLKSVIWLRDLHFYAYHGVMEQEKRVGGWFTLTLGVECREDRVIETDGIADALNYAELYEVVRREMLVPSNLIEHVAGRIGKAVFQAFPQASSVDLWLRKDNPPMGADGGGAEVELHLINDKT